MMVIIWSVSHPSWLWIQVLENSQEAWIDWKVLWYNSIIGPIYFLDCPIGGFHPCPIPLLCHCYCASVIFASGPCSTIVILHYFVLKFSSLMCHVSAICLCRLSWVTGSVSLGTAEFVGEGPLLLAKSDDCWLVFICVAESWYYLLCFLFKHIGSFAYCDGEVVY